MALEKLVITPYDKNKNRLDSESVKASFNPTEYSLTKSVNWATEENKSDRRFNAPGLEFKGGYSRVLSLNLFFDVTDQLTKGKDTDVRHETNKLVVLTQIVRGQDQPPVIQIMWGNAPTGSDFPFTGVITQLSQTFILFTDQGKPLRANVSLSVLEHLDPETDKRKTDPELTTHVIKQGDQLVNISAELYGNPKMWRLIADANGIDNPRDLEIGRILTIPEVL